MNWLANVPAVPVQPALSARLLPTPAQIRFYVHATTTPPLPKLKTIDHALALRVSTIAKENHVHWALLAAVARRRPLVPPPRRPSRLRRRPRRSIRSATSSAVSASAATADALIGLHGPTGRE